MPSLDYDPHVELAHTLHDRLAEVDYQIVVGQHEDGRLFVHATCVPCGKLHSFEWETVGDIGKLGNFMAISYLACKERRAKKPTCDFKVRDERSSHGLNYVVGYCDTCMFHDDTAFISEEQARARRPAIYCSKEGTHA